MANICLNFSIFVAFILEAFILEYSLQKTGRFESAVESKIKELGLGIGQYVLYFYILCLWLYAVSNRQSIHLTFFDDNLRVISIFTYTLSIIIN